MGTTVTRTKNYKNEIMKAYDGGGSGEDMTGGEGGGGNGSGDTK